jgi:hypothetical protein
MAMLQRRFWDVVLYFDYTPASTVDRRIFLKGLLTRSATGPIPLYLFSVPELIRSGATMAASSTSACQDEGSLQKQRVEIRPEAFTRASKATPVGDAAVISSAFM